MTLKGLVKMKCCVVLAASGVTAMIVAFKLNALHAGISGTVALVYGLAVAMYLAIAIQDRRANRQHPEYGLPDQELTRY